MGLNIIRVDDFKEIPALFAGAACVWGGKRRWVKAPCCLPVSFGPAAAFCQAELSAPMPGVRPGQRPGYGGLPGDGAAGAALGPFAHTKKPTAPPSPFEGGFCLLLSFPPRLPARPGKGFAAHRFAQKPQRPQGSRPIAPKGSRRRPVLAFSPRPLLPFFCCRIPLFPKSLFLRLPSPAGPNQNKKERRIRAALF